MTERNVALPLVPLLLLLLPTTAGGLWNFMLLLRRAILHGEKAAGAGGE